MSTKNSPEPTHRGGGVVASSSVPWLREPGRVRLILGGGVGLWLLSLAARLVWPDDIRLFYELGLLYLVVVGWLGPAFLRARREALRGILDQHVAGDPVFESLYASYLQRYEQGWRPLAAGLAVAILFIGFRWGISWDVLPYRSDLARLAVTLAGALASGLFVRTLWLLLGFGGLVTDMSRELEGRGARLFSLELLERAGAGYARTAFGASFLSMGLFWMVMASRSLLIDRPGDLAETLPSMMVVLLLALVVPLAYLVIPIWRLHRIMAQRKEEIRRLFAAEHAATEARFLAQPDREMAEAYLRGRQVIAEIDNLPEWPFRFEALAKVITVVAVPGALFICKEILVDVLVELLKK